MIFNGIAKNSTKTEQSIYSNVMDFGYLLFCSRLVTKNCSLGDSDAYRHFRNILFGITNFWESIPKTPNWAYLLYARQQLGSIIGTSISNFLHIHKTDTSECRDKAILATKDSPKNGSARKRSSLNICTYKGKGANKSGSRTKGQQMIYLINFVPSRGLFDPSPQACIEVIQSAPTREWWHYLKDTWIIVSSEHTVNDVYERLQGHLLTNDRLLILSLNRQTEYQGLQPSDAWDWLSQKLQSSESLDQ